MVRDTKATSNPVAFGGERAIQSLLNILQSPFFDDEAVRTNLKGVFECKNVCENDAVQKIVRVEFKETIPIVLTERDSQGGNGTERFNGGSEGAMYRSKTAKIGERFKVWYRKEEMYYLTA